MSPVSLDYMYLIPVRIDLDEENARVTDAFLWSLRGNFLHYLIHTVKENAITPDEFAEWYCMDYGFATSVQELVATSLRKQIQNYQQIYFSAQQYIDNLQQLWQLQQQGDITSAKKLQKKLPVPVGFERQLLRISLEVRAGDMILKDQFEWDVFNPLSSPEMFAQKLCEDCQLELKWIPLVAHSIRENIYAYLQRHFLKNKKLQTHDSNVTGGGINIATNITKTYNESLGGDFTLASISDEDLVQHAKQQRQSEKKEADEVIDVEENNASEDDELMEDINVIRDEDELEEWEPHIVELGEDELEKIAAKEEREARYRRREFSSTSGRVTRQSARFT
jgi:hypothetical protein